MDADETDFMQGNVGSYGQLRKDENRQLENTYMCIYHRLYIIIDFLLLITFCGHQHHYSQHIHDIDYYALALH